MLSRVSGNSTAATTQPSRGLPKKALLHRTSVDILLGASAAVWTAVNHHHAAAPAIVLLPALQLCFTTRPKAPPASVLAAGCGGFWLGNQLGARFGTGMDRFAFMGLGGIVGSIGAQVALNEVCARAVPRAGLRTPHRVPATVDSRPWRRGTWALAKAPAPMLVGARY